MSLPKLSREDAKKMLPPAAPHGQSSVELCPTALARHRSASLALIVPSPLGSHTHSGEQAWRPTALPRMKRQSDAVGAAPLLTGWLQSPSAASAAVAAAHTPLSAAAATRERT